MPDRATRHLSLDVWKTLILPNPEFGKARLRYLAAELSLPAAKVEAVYREIKDGADDAAETVGLGMASAEVYDLFMRRLGRPGSNWWDLRLGMERLFAKYPPIVLPEVVTALRRVQAHGIGLSIGSNTNFIRGECLHDVTLGTWGIAWDFQVFSDQISSAKPHAFFWKVVTERALAHTGAAPHEILHIGDNRTCDGGCVAAGLQFAHVNGPEDVAPLLESVLDLAQAA